MKNNTTSENLRQVSRKKPNILDEWIKVLQLEIISLSEAFEISRHYLLLGTISYRKIVVGFPCMNRGYENA